MTPETKRKYKVAFKHNITPRTGGFYPKPGPGRANERYEKAANRRAADIYIQNFKTLQKARKISVPFA